MDGMGTLLTIFPLVIPAKAGTQGQAPDLSAALTAAVERFDPVAPGSRLSPG
ncbi:hypothetical protein GCM10011317_50200 [Niveispirillum cyanobacteriorum]|nr:hypothetical protein GCM10011317_50200 [Niveispirillum cyanobacteriorum]